MEIKWNEVTKFSQIVAIILFVVVFFAGFLIGRKSDDKVSGVSTQSQISQTSTTQTLADTNPTLTYTDSEAGFSLNYPNDFTIDQSYTYQELGPGKEIGGVKFTIPASLKSGTNLGSDSYISVEEIPQTQNCNAGLFLDQQGGFSGVQTVTDNGTTYSVASTTGAGAGNRYFETIYSIPGTSPCFAVRYFIHYGVIENYPPGSTKEFDQSALLANFDAIRRTLKISH